MRPPFLTPNYASLCFKPASQTFKSSIPALLAMVGAPVACQLALIPSIVGARQGAHFGQCQGVRLFYLFRFLRDPAHSTLQSILAGLLIAFGVALIVWGLVEHSPLLAIRGAVELLLVGGFVLGVVRRHRRLSGTGGRSQRP